MRKDRRANKGPKSSLSRFIDTLHGSVETAFDLIDIIIVRFILLVATGFMFFKFYMEFVRR